MKWCIRVCFFVLFKHNFCSEIIFCMLIFFVINWLSPTLLMPDAWGKMHRLDKNPLISKQIHYSSSEETLDTPLTHFSSFIKPPYSKLDITVIENQSISCPTDPVNLPITLDSRSANIDLIRNDLSFLQTRALSLSRSAIRHLLDDDEDGWDFDAAGGKQRG